MSDKEQHNASVVTITKPANSIGMPQVDKTALITKISNSTGMLPDVIDLIKKTVAPTLTWNELEAGLYLCQKRRLDPLQRQVSFIKFGGRMQVHVTIDGQRALAARTGNFVGSKITFLYNVDGKIIEGDFPPTPEAVLYGARATVKKRCGDIIGEFSALALYEEYLSKSVNGVAKEKPHVMLAKDAEALALRQAFSEDLSGMYEPAEFGLDSSEVKA